MFKKISILLICLILFSLGLTQIPASEDFELTANTEYKVLESGITLVTYTISIKNLNSNTYPKQFLLNLEEVEPQNVNSYESGTKLKTAKMEKDSTTQILVEFDEATLGKSNTKTFVLSYEDPNLAKKTGEVFEF